MNLMNSWKREDWVRAILHKVTEDMSFCVPFFSSPPYLSFTCQLESPAFQCTFALSVGLQSALKGGEGKILAGNGKEQGKWRKGEAEKIKGEKREEERNSSKVGREIKRKEQLWKARETRLPWPPPALCKPLLNTQPLIFPLLQFL